MSLQRLPLPVMILAMLLGLTPPTQAQPSLEVSSFQFAPSLLTTLPGICTCLNTTAPRGTFIMVAVRSNNTAVAVSITEFELVVTLASGQSLVSRAVKDTGNPTTVMVVLVPVGEVVTGRRVNAVVEGATF